MTLKQAWHFIRTTFPLETAPDFSEAQDEPLRSPGEGSYLETHNGSGVFVHLAGWEGPKEKEPAEKQFNILPLAHPQMDRPREPGRKQQGG